MVAHIARVVCNECGMKLATTRPASPPWTYGTCSFCRAQTKVTAAWRWGLDPKPPKVKP